MKDTQASAGTPEMFSLKPTEERVDATERHVQRVGEGVICRTDYRPRKRSPLELVVDATEGFVPLWEENLVLRWRFNAASLAEFQNEQAVKETVRQLLSTAIAAWGDSAPIRFTEESDNSDFEIVVKEVDDCTSLGCTLAQAFFPDAGRHPLYIFPKMFTQTEKEQVDTLVHEIGHVFGLRHYFAPESESEWPSEIFGEHKPFSIMNYGAMSELTETDRSDLRNLYHSAWSGELTKINHTPIKLVRPFHYLNA